MKPTGLLAVTLAASTLALGACSNQNGNNLPPPEQAEKKPAMVGSGGAGSNLTSDDAFVRDVALKNMAEIQISRLAIEKTANPDIKSFAQRVIDDHSAAGDKLKSAVSGETFDWPAELDNKHKDTVDELAQERGAEFDRDYLKAMVESHQDLAAKLESRLDVQSLADWKTAAAGRTRSSKAMPDPGKVLSDVAVRPDASDNAITGKINQWAADTYPVAQQHLDAARSLESPTTGRGL